MGFDQRERVARLQRSLLQDGQIKAGSPGSGETLDQAQIAHLMPRILDAFTAFLSGIDPAAYDKRGVLEIIRAELLTRSRYVLGTDALKDLLITEFRFK